MFRSSSFYPFLMVVFALLAGCSPQGRRDLSDSANSFSQHDRDLGYSRDDFRRAMAPRPSEMRDSLSASEVPELAPVIADDKKSILPQPLVSISVNQDVPIRDIFFELAKQAEVDLELDPTITGSIIFTAYNRPFDQVVERIADMAGLRYTFKNNVMRVERDTPFLKTYHIDYLSVQRNFTSSITTNTSASAGVQGGGSSGGGGGKNGSSSSISTQSSTDFWNELETNITQIIENTNKQVALTDQSAPVTTPQAIPAVSAAQLATVTAPGEGPALPAAATSTATPTNITVNMAAPTPGLLNPTGTQSAAGTTASGAGSATTSQNPYFSVNRQGGLINVFATGKQHEKVAAYIAQLRRAINTQVLIEAKIFEVDLRDEYSLGIDWGYLRVGNGTTDNLGLSLARQNFVSDSVDSTQGGIIAVARGDFRFAVDAISRFGTVHTLSSPRLSVMNNQTAVLNVSESRIFFTLDINRTLGTVNTPATLDIESEINSVPEGVIITVHPTVDPDTNEITMNLRPSITRVVNTVSDPATRIVSGGDVESFVPEMSIREIDSIVKMNSGNTIIMGGLMQDSTDSRELSVPVLSHLPVLGPLFRSKRDGTRKTEMVIMLRATVVGEAKPDGTDKDLYRKMGQDRHPIDFQD